MYKALTHFATEATAQNKRKLFTGIVHGCCSLEHVTSGFTVARVTGLEMTFHSLNFAKQTLISLL